MKDPTYHQRMGGRTRAKIDLLRRHWDVNGASCFDIGAGRGDFTYAMLDAGAADVLVVESSQSFIHRVEYERKIIVYPETDIVDYVDAHVEFRLVGYVYSNVTLCLSVFHHIIGDHDWAVAIETWRRIVESSNCVYFEIGLPSENGSYYWKDKMKGMTDQDVLDKFADGCKIFEQIGQLPIHGVPRPIFYVQGDR